MTFIKFLFVLVILVPIALLMLILFNKLTGQYSAAVKKSREKAKEAHQSTGGQQGYSSASEKDYRRENPRYDAYRREMERKRALMDQKEQDGSQPPRNAQRSKDKKAGKAALSKRKRRKDRKAKKKEKEQER